MKKDIMKFILELEEFKDYYVFLQKEVDKMIEKTDYYIIENSNYSYIIYFLEQIIKELKEIVEEYEIQNGNISSIWFYREVKKIKKENEKWLTT